MLASIIDEKKEQIEKLFARLERYMKILAGADFLKFDEVQPEDLLDLYKPDAQLVTQMTNLTMEEMMSVASHLIGKKELQLEKSHSSAFVSARDEDIRSNSFLSKHRPQNTIEDDLPVSHQETEIQSIIHKSRTQLQRKITLISKGSNEQMPTPLQTKPFLQHMFTQKEETKPRELISISN